MSRETILNLKCRIKYVDTSRFVNSIISSNVENKVIWSHISSLRHRYLKKNISPKCFDGFISNEDISNNFQEMSIWNANEVLEDMEYNRKINEAAKMFFALNSCTSFVEKLYMKVIYGPDSKISMLASNILKKAKGDFKVKALKIFRKIISILGFQHISYNHGENKSVELNRNIFDVKGKTEMNKFHVHQCQAQIEI